MSVLLTSIRTEFIKLLSKKKYIVLFVLGAGFCFLRYGVTILLQKISQGSVQIRSNLMLEMLPLAAEIVIPLIVFMAAADLFCAEIQEDTIKAALLRPATRLKVFTAKVIAVFLMGAVFFLGVFVVCALIQLLSGSPIMPVLLPTLAAYCIDLVPMLGVVLFGALVNMLSAGPTLAMLLSIGIYAVCKYINYFVAVWGQMLFTAYLQWHKLWLGETLPLGAMLSKIGLIAGSILIFYTVGYMLFERKEV